MPNKYQYTGLTGHKRKAVLYPVYQVNSSILIEVPGLQRHQMIYTV